MNFLFSKRNKNRTHRIWNYANPNDPICVNDGYVIHHKDKNPGNDNPNNLQKMLFGEHSRLHHTGKYVRKETRDKLVIVAKRSSRFTGKSHSMETKEKMSAWQIGKRLSKETKLKISKAHIGMKQSKETKLKRSVALKLAWARRKGLL